MKPGLMPADGHLATALTVIAAGLVLELYANDVTPSQADTAATYTRLAVLGYSAMPLSSSADAWRLEVDRKAGHVVATYREELTFRFGAYGPTVHGYLLSRGLHLFGVQPFDSPFRIENRGDSIALTPVFGFGKAAR